MTKPSRVAATLSLARKAGKLTIGFMATKNAITDRKALLVILTSDISESTEKKIMQVIEDMPILKIKTTGDDIEAVMKRRFVVASITDINLKELFLKAVEEDI